MYVIWPNDDLVNPQKAGVDGLMIVSAYDVRLFYDHSIAYHIGLKYEEYRDILLGRFNARLSGYFHTKGEDYLNVLCFDDLEDAQKALEWAESLYIVRKLSKTTKE